MSYERILLIRSIMFKKGIGAYVLLTVLYIRTNVVKGLLRIKVD